MAIALFPLKRALLWLLNNRLLAALALITLIGHLVVRGVYEPDNVDDPWTLSFIYNWLTHGIVVDATFGNAISSNGGQNGLEHFGKLQGIVYGPLLQLVDWNRNVAHALSSLLVLFAIPMWHQIANRITNTSVPTTIFAVCLLACEPIVTASNEARPDALAFLLVTTALYFTTHGSFLLAGLFSLIAFEVHPMGLISVLYSLAVYLSGATLSRASVHVKAGLSYAFGAGIGCCVYIALHWDSMATLLSVVSTSNGSGFGKSLTMYAFNSESFRHVPEAIAFVVALGVFLVSGLWRKERAITFLVLSAVVSLIVFRRGNHHYMLYYAPVALLIGYAALSRLRHWALPVTLFIGLMVSQYWIISWRNAGFSIDAYVEQMRRHVPSTEVPVVSELNGWFAFYNRQYYGSYYDDSSYYMNREEFSALLLREFILVDRLVTPQGASVGWRNDVLPLGVICEPRGFFTLQRRHYGTFYCADPATLSR